jgi:multicomponent K+:H+ antiporter subunit A
MLILTGIAHQSERSHRYNNARAAEEAQAAAAPQGEGPWN